MDYADIAITGVFDAVTDLDNLLEPLPLPVLLLLLLFVLLARISPFLAGAGLGVIFLARPTGAGRKILYVLVTFLVFLGVGNVVTIALTTIFFIQCVGDPGCDIKAGTTLLLYALFLSGLALSAAGLWLGVRKIKEAV